MDLDKGFLVGGKQQHCFLFLMFQLFKEALGSGQATVLGYPAEKLYYPLYVQHLMKVLMNDTSDGRMTALSTCSTLPNDLIEFLKLSSMRLTVYGALNYHITDDVDFLLEMIATSIIAAFSSLLTLK